jgi:DNA-binding MarR family transcriptional regulator
MIMESQLNRGARGGNVSDCKMIKKLGLPQWNELLVKWYHLPDHQRYCQKLQRNIDSASSHIRSIVFFLEKENLIQMSNQSKIKHIVLTEKGKRTAQIILQLKESLRG